MNLDISKILDNFSKEYIKTLESNLRKDGNVASGDAIKSIRSKINKDSLEIHFNEYLTSISEGRKKSRKNPSPEMVDRIVSWMKYKNMRPLSRDKKGRFRKQDEKQYKRSAFALSKGILRNGYRGSNVFARTMRDVEYVLSGEMMDKLTLQLETEFDNILINFKKTK